MTFSIDGSDFYHPLKMLYHAKMIKNYHLLCKSVLSIGATYV